MVDNIQKNGFLGNFGINEIAILGCAAYASITSMTRYRDLVTGCLIGIPALLLMNKAGGDKTDFQEGAEAKFALNNFSLAEVISCGTMGYGAYRLWKYYGDMPAAVCAAASALAVLFFSGRTNESITL